MLSASKMLNRLLESSDTCGNELIREMDSLINRMGTGEQMELHGALSSGAIDKIYPLLDQLSLADHAKEHIAWSYFKRKIDGSESLSDELLHEMLECHAKHRFLAIESLFVEMLKHDALSMHQLERVENVFSGKAFVKEATACKCRHKVGNGHLLDESDVSELLRLGAYAALAFALDRKAITAEGLKRIVEPGPGEKDRTKKLALYKKARRKQV